MLNSNYRLTSKGHEYDFNEYIEGDELSQSMAVTLEEFLQAHPEDVNTRLKLLYFYGSQKPNQKKWLTHAAWIIDRRPSDWLSGNMCQPKGISDKQFKVLSELWRRKIDESSNNQVVVGRYAEFIAQKDTQTAIQLLQQVTTSRPKDSYFWKKLFYLYSGQSHTDNGLYSKAISAGESALENAIDEGEVDELLTALCKIALKNKDIHRASSYAAKLLELAQRLKLDHSLFLAHCLNGIVAIQGNDIGIAKNELLAAAQYGFFPSLELANQMLALGEVDCVKEFLQRCIPSAGANEHLLKGWFDDINVGKRPFLKIVQSDLAPKS